MINFIIGAIFGFFFLIISSFLYVQYLNRYDPSWDDNEYNKTDIETPKLERIKKK